MLRFERRARVRARARTGDRASRTPRDRGQAIRSGLGRSPTQSAVRERQDVSSRAHPPNGDDDSAYPTDVGAEIERQSTVKAVRKRLTKRMKAGESPPAKPKLVWTAEELALLTGTQLGPADRDRANPLYPGERNSSTQLGRHRGPYLIERREQITAAYRVVRDRNDGRRPTWTAVAKELGVDERTLRRARVAYGLDGKPIE